MKFIKTSILCLATVAAAACHKSEAPTATDGTITFAVAAQQEVNDVTRSKVSDITDLPGRRFYAHHNRRPKENHMERDNRPDD